MRNKTSEEYEELMTDEEGEWRDDHPENLKIADWKERADSILGNIDCQLSKFGLEVVSYDTLGDYYAWTIEKREVKVGDKIEVCFLSGPDLTTKKWRSATVTEMHIDTNSGLFDAAWDEARPPLLLSKKHMEERWRFA